MHSHHRSTWFIFLLLIVAVAGCSDDDTTLLLDHGLSKKDGGAADGALKDKAAADKKITAKDATSGPLSGVGKLSGACGVLDDTEWKSTKPFLFRNAIDFGAATFDWTKLSAGGQKIWKEGNLGGSSVHSEIFAHEVLYRCELAKLLKTESKITYTNTNGKKTDMLLNIDARKIGVSVTRAFHYPPTNPYTQAEAKTLLDKKLADLPKSKANATPGDAWTRSILHVLAYNKQHADMVQAAWSKQVSATTKGDAILMLTVTDGNDAFIY